VDFFKISSEEIEKITKASPELDILQKKDLGQSIYAECKDSKLTELGKLQVHKEAMNTFDK
jgi:hypothetical protein